MNTLLHDAFEDSKLMNNSYAARIKKLMDVLDLSEYTDTNKQDDPKLISSVAHKNIKYKYEKFFFDSLKPTGRTNIYHQVKKHYSFEKYLQFITDHKLRRTITAIRLSCHCLPIEILRRRGIHKDDRKCNICFNYIGTEMHVLAKCQDPYITSIRSELKYKLIQLNSQFTNFDTENIMRYLLLANDKTCTILFAVFLKKIFRHVYNHYQHDQ